MFFTKNPNLKKNSKCFFFCFFLSRGWRGEGKARVSECLTMDPNKKNVFGGGGGGGGGGRGGG